ncbi:uncharacterized protein [Paramisgurnus dabryanus]|uniref:uncharacterized protein n=1 Tax=Paramisgurnus dabryanus TaxID=90735 RepID=UPI0031F4489A
MSLIMMQLVVICFTVIILTKGASVKVHPGGNVTLSCTIKDDQEINWIVINDNQTFVTILRLQFFNEAKVKLSPSFTHPDYEGRIIAVSSLTHTHSLILMNITSTDLIIYCCMKCHLEQTYCTKLDFKEQQVTALSHDLISSIWLPVLCVLVLLILSVCVCWRGTGLQRGCGTSKDLHPDSVYNIAQGEFNHISKRQDDRTLVEVLYVPML